MLKHDFFPVNTNISSPSKPGSYANKQDILKVLPKLNLEKVNFANQEHPVAANKQGVDSTEPVTMKEVEVEKKNVSTGQDAAL